MSHHDPKRRTPDIILTAIAVTLFTFALSAGGWFVAGRPASEYPDYLQAGAALATLGAAIVAGFYAARAFRIEMLREERWEHTQRTAQASRVAAWPLAPSYEYGPLDEKTGRIEPAALQGWKVRLRNASDMPIAQVHIGVTLVMGRRRGEIVEELAVGTHFLTHFDPETTTDIEIGAADPASLDQFLSRYFHEVRVELTFSDAVGTSWTRSTDKGELRETVESSQTVVE